MALNTAGDVMKELESIVKHGRDEENRVLAAALLSVMMDIGRIGERVMTIEKHVKALK